MWDWVRCGSLLIYVFVDNQTEKLFELAFMWIKFFALDISFEEYVSQVYV